VAIRGKLGCGCVDTTSTAGAPRDPGQVGAPKNAAARPATPPPTVPYSQPQTPSRDDALTDAQTGLPNLVHASVVLETGWALALRGNGLAVVILELGRHGPSDSLLTPEAAEHAVQTLACILVDRTRRMDLCARFSAGRFIVVLLDCPLEQAERFARDIEDRFNASEFPWSKTQIRVGSAAIEDGMGSPDVLIAAADRALHRAGQVDRVHAPAVAERDAPAEAAAPPASQPPTQLEALQVLVADDDEATLRATRRMLERFGCVVTAVSTSREALGRVTGSETIDLLVTDIVMPEMSGFTLVNIATKAREDLPVLYMSGYPQEEVYWGGTPGSRSAFLSKPMEMDELRGAIVGLLGIGEADPVIDGTLLRRGERSSAAPAALRLEIDAVRDEGVRLDGKILVVDDDQSVVGSLQRLFRRVGYAKPAGISDPRLVEEYVRNEHVDLIILDLHMPELDGFQVLVSLAPLLSPEEYLPVLILTGDDSPEVRQRALAAGAMDFLTKPFDMAEDEARVRNLLATRSLTKRVAGHRDLLEEKIWERTAELADTRTEILHRLGRAAEYRDDVTGRHAERVGLMASLLAAELGLDARQVDLIRRTAPLHDVGKIGVPDALLRKPGQLSRGEFLIMQTHTTVGEQILGGSPHRILAVAAKIARGHHERWDGGGHPDGTRGVEISLDARIVAVADVFDVLTHTRPYQGAFPLHEVRQIIVDGSGKHFDPDVVEALKVIYDRVGPDKILGLADPIDPMRDIISSRTTTTTPD